MCATCGCSDEAGVRVSEATGSHGHGHGRRHGGDGDEESNRTVTLEQEVLAKNDLLAARNRDYLSEIGVVAVNLMSSPGSGKTTVLEHTVRELVADIPVCVVEGDQETRLDAERIRSAGAPVVQINTGAGCHLDAQMLAQGLDVLDLVHGCVLFVENVGNLVCPALFDLGEHQRVVIMSVTEGADKPLKYPHMFSNANLVLLNKVDLLPYVDFDVSTFYDYVRKIRPRLDVVPMSATTGDGLPEWYAWLRQQSTREPGGQTITSAP